jgi:hypothetical protein
MRLSFKHARRATFATVPLLLVCTVTSLTAQGTTPTGTIERPALATSQYDSSAIAIVPSRVSQRATAAELSYGIALYENGVTRLARARNISAWRDTVSTAVATRAQSWISQLNRSLVQGIQLDAMGQLFVAAGNEAQAIAQFDERLATPGFPLADRIYTYQVAFGTFFNLDNPKRLAIAQHYADQLFALPIADAGYWQFAALASFVRQYDLRGRSRDVIATAARAVALVPSMSFLDRSIVYNGDVGSAMYVAYADALAGIPGGHARLDTLNAHLLAGTAPAASLVSRDSAYLWLSQLWSERFQQDMAMTANLGRPAAALTAHRWFNASGDSAVNRSWTPHTRQLNDGKIRLIEFGNRYCHFCMEALPVMNRMHQAFVNRGVEVWYVTRTYGIWNSTFIDRDEEVDRLQNLYLSEKELTLPIALWAGEKQATEDDGLLPQESPNVTAYHITAEPTLYLIDGNGFVRHIFRGFSTTAGDEQRARALIEHLVQERAARSAAP